MAIYRNIHVSFWTDGKIVDDFTPEDKYFYIYLLTNPHTNLCGCYEISLKQMSDELGYNKETIERLIDRFHTIHKVLAYSKQTKEMLIYNWWKYNWTSSSKLRGALAKHIPSVKCPEFRDYLISALDGDTVSVPYEYGMDTPDTDTDTDTDTNTDTVTKKSRKKKADEVRHQYGEYKNVLLSDADFAKLKAEFSDWEDRIERLSFYMKSKKKTYDDHLATIRNWARRDKAEAKVKQGGQEYDDDDLDFIKD